MRSQAALSVQKVSDAQAALLKPLALRVHNYLNNGVRLTVKSQQNLNMTRDFKATLELDYYGKTYQVVVDRDELIMALQTEGR